MEIKIDTSRDSKEEIKKIVDFLQIWLGEQALAQQPISQQTILPGQEQYPTLAPEKPSEGGIFNMFDMPANQPIQTGMPEQTFTMQPAVQAAAPTASDLLASAAEEADSESQEEMQIQPVQEMPKPEQALPTTNINTITERMGSTQPAVPAGDVYDALKKQPRRSNGKKPANFYTDYVQVKFDKTDDELEEVKRLKKLSKSGGESLRIVPYK
ncbi:MAG: hypothetical protein V1743_00140 [Nanoarchaeota archaeon]